MDLSAPPRDVAGDWSGPALEESSTLVARPDDPVTLDRVLRRLDVLRQRLSVRWCGVPGAFAGYDRLEMTQASAVTAGTIRFVARLVDADRGSHVVELVAIRTDDVRDHPERVTEELLVAGCGRTLEIGH